MAYQIEVTDTFGGEANYCWVRREEAPETATRRQLVRMAKRLAGLTGERCSTSDMGDLIEIRPIGRNAPCIIAFIQWQE